MIWEIYEEGYRLNGESAQAIYLGTGNGETFLEACKDYISRTGRGEIRKYRGKEYACSWGCKWYPTLKQAQKNFG